MKWINDIYKAKAVMLGGIVRRGLASLPRGISPQMIIDDAKVRGYNAVMTGGQVVIFCTPTLHLT